MILRSKFKIPTGCELLKSISNARQEWIQKNALHKWYYLYGIGKVPFDLTRTPLFREDVETVHFYGYFAILYICTATVLMMYTIVYYSVHGEAQKCLPCTCLIIIALGVRMKYFCYIFFMAIFKS